ncbi:MOSC domain-containing protein [Streptomyces sp. WAC 01529]|uniref:MOSC domain-containing protein n=1 Tax=Streptomyces sp. WAC 01529 TaxID=2203205 RepID=UPI000F71293A|nr:MOSC domain-containing protein [Streptomyces sp. WAC 01529]AZM52953.1 MOSC domain-containing protein [Streptomyces sp. WAC 01529]
MDARVTAVSGNAAYSFSKPNRESVTLVAGFGVEGDVHAGEKVKHRFRVRQNPDQPNLRQVHLIHEELFDELAADGFTVAPGELGENITTCGVDLLGLPTGTLLRLGGSAVVEVTGLRTPCRQIDTFRAGLMKKLVGRDADGAVAHKAGIMSVVVQGGEIHPGDPIEVVLPEGPHRPLRTV